MTAASASLASSSVPLSIPAHPVLGAVRRLPGRIVVSWSMAGGLVAGGFLVAATTLAGRSSSSAIPQMTTFLFGLGAAAGLAHGGLLGYLCRDPARTRWEVICTLTRSMVWLVPGLLMTWVAALWISLTASVVGGTGPATFSAFWVAAAWLYGVGVALWAAWCGVEGVLAALRRWPDVRVAAWVMSGVFAVLVTRFLAAPPEIWFTHLRVTSLGAVVLAFGASVWIALPVMIAALGLAHRLARRA